MATAVEIAQAYVALTVKMPGVQSEIGKALGGPGVRSTLAGSGKSMGAALAGAVGGAVAAVTSKAIGTVMGSIDSAIKRVDIMNNFPKIMQNLGYSATDASKSIKTMSDRLTGLPTSLDAIAGVVQQLAPLTGGLDEATNLSLALNNALLAGGKSTEIQSYAMEQYAQQLAIGKVDMAAWRSMVTAMPGQMDQLSKSLLGGTARQTDLYEAMKSGEVSFDQFNAAILDLNENGFGNYASFADQAISATEGIGTAQQNLGTAITRGLSSLIQKFQPQITAAFAAVTLIVNETFSVVAATFDWIADNIDWLGPLAVGVTAAVVAFKAWNAILAVVKAAQAGYAAATYGAVAATYASTVAEKIGVAVYALKNSTLATTITAMRLNEALTLRSKVAIIASTAATTAAAGAQRLFNAALAANPIGLIITAITALVAGLVWFFTQTETGKAIWGEFTRFLGEAWANISAFFVEAWENVIQPVFKGIGEVATWLWENVLSPVFSFIGDAVAFLAAGFKLQFDLIVNAFRLVGAIGKWLWEKALAPAFDAIGKAATWMWENSISPVVDFIAGAFTWLWENRVRPIVDAFKEGLRLLGEAFSWLYKNAIRPAWEAIEGVLKAGWSWIDKNVFSPFKTGIDLLAKGFEVGQKAIAKSWGEIKKAAAVPINFVLDTVWNKGLRSFWNDIVGTLGLGDMKLAKAPLVKFASGGVLPGYTPGRDVHQFYSPTGGRLALSGGEAIMRPEFTRAVGGKAGVDRLNAMARNGQAFKDGGVWDNLGNFAGDVLDNIKGAATVAWDFITNPAKAIKSHIVDKFLAPVMGGQNMFKNLAGAVPRTIMNATAKLFENATPKGVGTAGMGWQAMQELVLANVPGARITSGYRSPAGNAAVGGAKGSYHMQGRAIDIVPASMATFNAVRRLFPNASELIYSPAGGAQLLRGKPFDGWSDAVRRQHYDHVHLAMANGGVVPKLYDQGGWLPHGGVAVNRSGKPEPVLTNDQWQTLGKGGLRSGDRLVLRVGAREFDAYVEERAGVVLDRDAPSSQMVHTELNRL